MKLSGSVGTLGLAVIASSFVAQPAQAGHFVYGGCYGYPHYYHSCFSFGWGGCYAPPPVFVAPPPVVYYAPPPVVYYAPQPVVVQTPPAVQQPAPVEQPAPQAAPSCASPPRGPVFVETARRCHEHGDNAGQLDWVEGLLDGRPMRTYYDDYGRVKKQKWID